MKILVATPIFPPEIGGPATYTKELAERLHSNHSISIVTYADNVEPIPHTRIVAVSKKKPLPIRLMYFTKALFMAAREADLIYVQNAMAAGLPAAIIGLLLRKPVILKFVGDEAWERATQYRLTSRHLEEFLKSPSPSFRIACMRAVQGWVLRRVTLVTTPSKYLGEAIQKAYAIPAHRVKINYNAADKTTGSILPTEPKQHHIAVTARLVEWKGIDGIIRAVSLLRNKYPDIHLTIAGDGPERKNLETLATELEVRDVVTFKGNVSRSETWLIRKESQVYVLNSTYEGLPHTALTSFAADIPVVATDIPGTNEAVYDGVSGLLVPIDNPEALALGIEKIFMDPALGTKLTQGGQKILHEKFSWDAHLSTLNDFFREAVAGVR